MKFKHKLFFNFWDISAIPFWIHMSLFYFLRFFTHFHILHQILSGREKNIDFHIYLLYTRYHYKSHTAVALSKSFSSASLKLTITLLLLFPLDSNRTEVIAQRMTCSIRSGAPDPQIDCVACKLDVSRPFDPPIIILSLLLSLH